MKAMKPANVEIRDRIKELRRVPAAELIANPKNWRRHPKAQRQAMEGLLKEIGYAGALIARETPDGLMLIDGHLRKEVTPDAVVPVLVLDVDEAEADLLLATYDPIGAMAAAARDTLQSLLAEVGSGEQAVNDLLRALAGDHKVVGVPSEGATTYEPSRFELVVELDGEAAQRELFERLTREGYRCRVLTL